MTSFKDIVWMAGWSEGEGSFLLSGRSPVFRICSTDFDVVSRAAKILNAGIYTFPPPGNRKKRWDVVLGGAWAAGWMMTLYSLMGIRRKEKIRKVLKTWRETKGWARATNGKFIPASCHPELPSSSRGLCEPCYERFRYANLNPEKIKKLREHKRIQTNIRMQQMDTDERESFLQHRRDWYHQNRTQMTKGQLNLVREKARNNMRKFREKTKQTIGGQVNVNF